MSRLVSRILLSIFMFPLAGTFYAVVAVVMEQSMRYSGGYAGYRAREVTMFLTAGVLTWVFVAIYWCLLWRTGVRWNSRRIVGTWIAAAGASAAGAVVGVLAAAMASGEASFGVFVGGVVAIMLWLIATIFLWRETTAERAHRVTAATKSAITCPTCGYNLTGLTESRCPECGSRFTLDELLALQQQPGAGIEIE